jgi:hypothetical protein
VTKRRSARIKRPPAKRRLTGKRRPAGIRKQAVKERSAAKKETGGNEEGQQRQLFAKKETSCQWEINDQT